MTITTAAAAGTRRVPRPVGESGTALGPRARFIVRRLLRLLVSVWFVATATFALLHLVPGDPVRAALGVSASAELVASRREQLGLNQPLIVQYLDYIGGLFRGDLGVSLVTQVPVSEIIAQRFPVTVSLAVISFVIVLVVGVAVGLLVAVATQSGRGRGVELAFAGGTGLLVAIPEFFLAVSLIAVFGVILHVLPVAGQGGVEHLVLPIVTLTLAPTAFLARIVRVEALSVLGLDYIRTARAKRLPARLIYLRHALPNMLTASLTSSGMMLSALIAGTVVVETIFALPGMGATIVNSIIGKDYPVVQGIVLVYALFVLAVNLVVDVVLVSLDPRSTILEG